MKKGEKMKKNYKTRHFFVLLTVIVAMLCLGFKTNAYTEEQMNFTDADYTDSDYMLSQDKTTSESYSLLNFTDYIKSVSQGSEVENLDGFIPVKHLASKNGTVFYYFGDEYGYYGVLDLDELDLLIIDFTYGEFSNRSNEQSIRINPVLQESFSRTRRGTGYRWNKIDNSSRNKYYVSNPRFAVMVENANENNSYDNGYDISADSGSIISQTRVNYGNVMYKDEFDLVQQITNFTIDLTIGALIGKIAPLSGNIISTVLDTMIFGLEVMANGKEQVVQCNNEANIYTFPSRNEQLDKYQNYSRFSSFASNEEIILNSSIDSYAELITMVDKTNVKSRITEMCDFDIVYRKGNYSSMNYVAGCGNEDGKTQFYTSKVKVLYDDVADELTDNLANYYLLDNCTMIFNYTPECGGYFSIDGLNSNIELYVDGNAANADGFYLTKSAHKLLLKSRTKEYGTLNISPCILSGNVSIASGGDFIYKYNTDASMYYILEFNQCTITVLDNNYNVLTTDRNKMYYQFAKDRDYYIMIENKGNDYVYVSDASIRKENFSILETGQEYETYFDSFEEYYKFIPTANSRYEITFIDVSNLSVNLYIYIKGGTSIGYEKKVGNDVIVFKTGQLNSNNTYYFVFETQTNDLLKFNVSRSYDELLWRLNGEIYSSESTIKRGVSYTIDLLTSDSIILTTYKYISIGPSYSSIVELSYSNKSYVLNIPSNATMYRDKEGEAKIYLSLNVYGYESSSLDLKVVNQYDEIEIDQYSFNEFEESAYINIKTKFLGKNEVAKIVFEYQIDKDSTKYELTIDYKSSNTQIILNNYISTINRFNIDIIIKEIKVYLNDYSGLCSVIYNTNYYKNADKINKTSSDRKYMGLHFESGDGSVNDPFIIANCKQFNEIDSTAVNGNIESSFKLENINFYAGVNAEIFEYTFNGVFDGNGVELHFPTVYSNFSEGDFALFKEIGTNGVIKNLNMNMVINGNVRSSSNKFGVLCVVNNGSIMSCTIISRWGSSSSIVAEITGGVCAINRGRIKGTTVDCSLSGGKYCGGFAGISEGGQIWNCTFSGYIRYGSRVTNNDYIGGFAGFASDTTFINNTYCGKIIVAVRDWESREYAPYIGYVIGSGSNSPFASCFNEGQFDLGNLNTDVSWWAWFQTHHFNQQGNVTL